MIVCDTGPLLAALNAEDKHHAASLDLLEAVDGPLVVPAPILTEVCDLVHAVRPRHCSAFELLPL